MNFIKYIYLVSIEGISSIIDMVHIYIESFINENTRIDKFALLVDGKVINNLFNVWYSCLPHFLKLIPTIIVFIYRIYRVNIRAREYLSRIKEKRSTPRC